MANSGVKSNIAVRGTMRRRGDSSGSVILSSKIVNVFGRGVNQDNIALRKMAMVSIWHRILIKLNNTVIVTQLPSFFALLYAAVTACVTRLLNPPLSNWRIASAVVPPGEVTILRNSAGDLPDFSIRCAEPSMV